MSSVARREPDLERIAVNLSMLDDSELMVLTEFVDKWAERTDGPIGASSTGWPGRCARWRSGVREP